MLSAIMLVCFYACVFLSLCVILMSADMLSVIFLGVVMLSIVHADCCDS